jgi:hypothetical protein
MHCRDRRGRTALDHACALQLSTPEAHAYQATLVRMLLEFGCRPNAGGDDGSCDAKNVLNLAGANLQVVTMLLLAGAHWEESATENPLTENARRLIAKRHSEILADFSSQLVELGANTGMNFDTLLIASVDS